MKKQKKRKIRPSRPKGRPKQKQKPQIIARNTAPEAAADLYSGGLDFSASPAPTLNADLVNRAKGALRQGDPQAAVDLARQALQANPNDAEALNLAGVATFQTGEASAALDLLHTAVAFAPDNAEVHTNLGNVLAALNNHKEAQNAYTQAMAANPGYADAPFNLGVLMEKLERPGDALEAYTLALKISPSHSGAGQGRGNALKALKRLDEARDAYAAVLDSNPAMPEARTNLSAVLQELGDFDGAAREAKRAFEADPDLLEAEYNYAIALQELGRHEEAIEAYRHVLTHAPHHAACALNIGYGLQQLGRLDEAGQAFEKAVEIDPDFAKTHVNLADLRLQQGEPQAALDVCDTFLKSHRAQTDMMAFRAVCLWDLGQQDKTRELIDFKRLARFANITTPDGFDDLESFNEALSAHVLAHPTLTNSPQSHATRKGKHSGELLSDPKGPIAGLEAKIFELANNYRDALGDDDTHPFIAARPENWTLSVWGVVMQSAGHQIPHIHPAAWLSGVYYPKLPDISADGDNEEGWIEFGRPPGHFHNSREPETLAQRPEPGMMVLFPSYFYHRTVPFEASGTRISIAFDLMPA